MSDAPVLTAGVAVVFVAIAAIAALLSARRSWVAPAVVMLTAPFAWYHAIGPTDVTMSKAAFVGALIGASIRWARDPAARARAALVLRSNRALIALAALAVWAAASVWWAGTPVDAVRDALKWAWYAGVFGLTIALIESAEDRTRSLLAMLVAAAIAGIDGLWQHFTNAPAGFVAPSGEVVGRIASTLEGPNQFGAYLEAVIPALLALLLCSPLSRMASIGGGLLFGLLVSDLLLTYSRGALLACSVAVLVVVLAWIAARRPIASVQRRNAATALGVALLVVVAVAAISIRPSGWQHELVAPLRGTSTDSGLRRVQLWTCAVEVFERHPAVGVGAGNFPDAKQECGQQLAGSEHFNANEWYLETAADLGVVGLAALAAFLVSLLLVGRTSDVWREAATIGAYAVVIAFVVHGFVDDVLWYPKASLSFFVLAGFLFARPIDTPSPEM